MEKYFKITNIKWDTDGDEAALRMLPKEIIAQIYYDEESEIEDEISEYLSDNYGYCHFGFDYKKADYIKQTFYIEVVDNDLESDPPYILQSREFDTQEEAEDWAGYDFDFIANHLSIYLMSMNYINEDEYDVKQIKEIKKWKM